MICSVSGFLVAAASTLDAQPAAGLRARVVRLPGMQVTAVGTIERRSADSVTVRDATGTLWNVRLGTEHRLELSSGPKRNIVVGALIGGSVGALTGTLVGVAADHQADRQYKEDCPRTQALDCSWPGGRLLNGIEVMLGAVYGSVGGLVVGSLIGAIPRETWRAAGLPLQTTFVPTLDGRGVLVSVRFGRTRL